MRWDLPERHARKTLRERLSPYELLARSSHRLVAAAIATCMEGRDKPPGQAAEVQARLLVRLSHDLRVVQLAACRSYSLQALSITANVFELSNAVAYIGTSAERARAWESHKETKKTYPPLSEKRNAIKAMVLALVPDIEDLEKRVDDQEKLYETLCMAKHGNPKALRRFGVALSGNTMRLYHGPIDTQYVVRQGRFALYHAARMVGLAAIVFCKPLIDGAQQAKRRRYRRVERDLVARVLELAPNMPDHPA